MGETEYDCCVFVFPSFQQDDVLGVYVLLKIRQNFRQVSELKNKRPSCPERRAKKKKSFR